MTQKQLNLIAQLRDEMNLSDAEIDDVADNLLCDPGVVSGVTWQACTTEEASVLIDELLQMKQDGDY